MGENGTLSFFRLLTEPENSLMKKNTVKKCTSSYYLLLLSSKKEVSKRRDQMKKKELYPGKTFLLFLKSILNDWWFFYKGLTDKFKILSDGVRFIRPQRENIVYYDKT